MAKLPVAARRLDERLAFVHGKTIGAAKHEVERRWAIDGAAFVGGASQVALAKVTFTAPKWEQ
jgi:hypothetical protein